VRLALLSDTHGNPIAIDAVLADIEAVERCRHPSGGYIIRHFRGQMTPWWEQRTCPPG
jgi:hypothetical protein